MSSKIKNAIIFLSIGIVLILVYVFLIRQPVDQGALVSEKNVGPTVAIPADGSVSGDSVDKDFLPLLLSVKSIKLDDSIFKDPAFMSLVDGSIELTPDGTEGRPNPFAPFGSDEIVADSSTVTTTPPPNFTDSTNTQNNKVNNIPVLEAPTTPAGGGASILPPKIPPKPSLKTN